MFGRFNFLIGGALIYNLMNRSSAKLLTAIGIFFLLASVILSAFKLISLINVPIIFLPALFGGGIALIVLSLAYYTEK